jgi:hypothetical protein
MWVLSEFQQTSRALRDSFGQPFPPAGSLAAPFRLWILRVEEAVKNYNLDLNLPNVTLLPLRTVETEGLSG